MDNVDLMIELFKKIKKNIRQSKNYRPRQSFCDDKNNQVLFYRDDNTTLEILNEGEKEILKNPFFEMTFFPNDNSFEFSGDVMELKMEAFKAKSLN